MIVVHVGQAMTLTHPFSLLLHTHKELVIFCVEQLKT